MRPKSAKVSDAAVSTPTAKTVKSPVKAKTVSRISAKPVVAVPAPPAAKPAQFASARRPGKNGQKDVDKPIRKTTLSPADLDEFRELLMAKRHELVGDMNHLQNEALRQGSSGESSGISSMPIHMADLGSDTWEQELTLGLIENERGLLREIDDALGRIEDKTYGICLATNRPINKPRLRAKPWAKYCIEYERKRELGLV